MLNGPGDRSYTWFMTKKCRLLFIETCMHVLMEETDKDKFQSLLTSTTTTAKQFNSIRDNINFQKQLCGQKT